MFSNKGHYVSAFDSISRADINTVGGKNASLGEMRQQLCRAGDKSSDILVPNGFAVTADAFRDHIVFNDLNSHISYLLDEILQDPAVIDDNSAAIRRVITSAPLPPGVVRDIVSGYGLLQDEYGPNCDVAVRSSATAEDLPEASFAGQLETYLNISGLDRLLRASVDVFGSLFTSRAISYRMEKGLGLEIGVGAIAVSIGVQKMIRSDGACAGVAFTLDTESGFRDCVVVNSSYGLGESVVSGCVNPDEFYVHKPLLGLANTSTSALPHTENYRPVLKKRLGSKLTKIVYSNTTTASGSVSTETVPVPPGAREVFSLSDDELLMLTRQCCEVERHYGCAMDIEWAKDAGDGRVYIVQARPETVHSCRPLHQEQSAQHYSLLSIGASSGVGAGASTFVAGDVDNEYAKLLLLTGLALGRKIAVGRVKVIPDISCLQDNGSEAPLLVEPGDVIVTRMTNPDWVPYMERAAAIITEQGGRTCHAAIICRELGLPGVIGCGAAMATLTALLGTAEGAIVTVDCSKGGAGYVYKGELPFQVQSVALPELASLTPKPPARFLLNTSNPDEAFRTATRLGRVVAGVGLARIEFIVSNTVQVHPLALMHPERLERARRECTDDVSAARVEATIASIRRLAKPYLATPDSPLSDYFIHKLAEEVGTVAAAFYPQPVVVRLSDFKTNEYRSLLGGEFFEPEEINPALGYRGARRYYDGVYRAAFGLECAAMHRLRCVMGFCNVQLMVPFVRSVDEAVRVLAAMEHHGLARGSGPGPGGLQIHMMCETPENCISMSQYLPLFDGFSIGSNDLTQLTLGVDRDGWMDTTTSTDADPLASPGTIGALPALPALQLYDERNPAVKELIARAIDGAHVVSEFVSVIGVYCNPTYPCRT